VIETSKANMRRRRRKKKERRNTTCPIFASACVAREVWR
jgi:hypothetical protein